MRIDWRSEYAILTVPGKVYVLFLLFFCAWNGIALIRHSLLIGRIRTASEQSAKEAYAVLAAQQRNLRELLFLGLIYFVFVFCRELSSGIREWYYIWLNPQADIVAPIEAIQFLTQVSLGVFAVVQCSRRYMSARLDRVVLNQ
jgi:Na+/melibiose symporter-like transporter